jgi:hypothetical protein
MYEAIFTHVKSTTHAKEGECPLYQNDEIARLVRDACPCIEPTVGICGYMSLSDCPVLRDYLTVCNVRGGLDVVPSALASLRSSQKEF